MMCRYVSSGTGNEVREQLNREGSHQEGLEEKAGERGSKNR